MAGKSLAELAEKMKDIDFAILSTRTEGGAIAARPMSNNRDVGFDGDAWFFTCGDTRTVADIETDPRVGLAYQGKAGILGMRPFFVAVEGRAEPIRDKARFAEHWTSGLDRWFDKGIDTPGSCSSRWPRSASIIGTAPTRVRSRVDAGREPAAA